MSFERSAVIGSLGAVSVAATNPREIAERDLEVGSDDEGEQPLFELAGEPHRPRR